MIRRRLCPSAEPSKARVAFQYCHSDADARSSGMAQSDPPHGPSAALDPDILQASAARFLIDGDEEHAANLLLACRLRVWESGDTWYVGDEVHAALHVELDGPRVAYDALNDRDNPLGDAIRRALRAVLPSDTYIKHFTVRGQLLEIDPEWRTELLALARGRGVDNQAIAAHATHIWKNLRFRSRSEVRLAEALDRAGTLFLPNCRARLGLTDGRQNREADFLVCVDGRWGILEVDGDPFHPPSRTADDHARDRLFRAHGVRVVEHFHADRCYNEPDVVVREFLAILTRA